jgi:hypothetical protein
MTTVLMARENKCCTVNIVIPAKAGIHPAASACGAVGSRFRGNDKYFGNGDTVIDVVTTGCGRWTVWLQPTGELYGEC